MLIEARSVDSKGFIEKFIVVDSNNIPEGFITDSPDGLFKPRWTGTEWEEGITQEELDEITFSPDPEVPQIPLEERIAQLEAKNKELEDTLNALFGV